MKRRLLLLLIALAPRALGMDPRGDADARLTPDAQEDGGTLEAPGLEGLRMRTVGQQQLAAAPTLPEAPPPSVRRGHQTLLSKSALLNRANANKSSATYSPPIGICIMQTGRPCQPYNRGTIVDHLSQCHAHEPDYSAPAPRYNTKSRTATCSDGSDGYPAGTCVCMKGHCAETNMDCRKGLYEMLPGSFKLTTKLFGATEQLYMAGDGEVKIGTPPSADAAKWRISSMRSGVKQLFTDAYRNHVLMEYELCSSHVNDAGYTSKQCGNVAGHVKDPEAQETGWRLEIHSPLPTQTGFEEEHYLQLRSAYSGNILFVSPTLKDAQTCEDTANGCPGDYGAIHFHPSVPHEFHDHPPDTDRGLVILGGTWGVAILMVCLMYTLYNQLDNKATRYDDSLLWLCIIPLKECGKALGLRAAINKL